MQEARIGESSGEGKNTGRSICLISFSAIADDPRVRRQGDAFHARGWTVSAVGLPNARSVPPVWPIYTEAPKPEAPKAEVPQPEAPKVEVSSVPDATVSSAPVSGAAAPLPEPTKFKRLYQAIVPAVIRAPLHFCHHHARRLVYLPRWIVRKSLRLAALTVYKIVSLLIHVLCFIGNAFLFGIYKIASLFSGDVKKSQKSSTSLSWRLAPDNLRRYIANYKYYFNLISLRWRPERARAIYMTDGNVQAMYAAAKQVKADVYLANDWYTLPIAMKLAEENGACFGYDTHEYALEEYRYRLEWRLLRRPMARAVEGEGLAKAIVRSTVSAGIAEDMARAYGLPEPLLVIRNTPNRENHESPPCNPKRLKVLYHGLIARDRGLEDCIRSVPLWRPEFVFQLRGPVPPDYRAELDAIAAEMGVSDRVEFLPPVPMTELVASAADADVGISTPPKTSKHNVYALPNKFFEYIQSGLALCVADLPDMGRLVKEFDMGILIPEVTPESIAATVNTLTPDDINRFKKNSAAAAKVLNWQVEQIKLVDSYEKALENVRRARQ